MKILLNKNTAVFVIVIFITLLLGLVAPLLLPDKYYFDANLIVSDPGNEKGFMGSYSFTMWFYDFIKLNRLNYSIIAIIQLPVIFLIIRKLGIPEIFSKLYLRNALVWVSFVILGVYLGMPSKEFITIIYISIICFILQSTMQLKIKIFIITSLFLFFGFWFRPYFSLVPLLALALSLVTSFKIKNKVFLNILTGLLITCFISLSYGILKGEFMSEGTREKLNIKRQGRDNSQTIIVSPIKADNFVGESVSIFYGFFTVNFPINGLKFFYKPQVIAFVLWQLIMSVYILFFYNKCLKQRSTYSQELWVFHYIIAYFIIQGVFEPDLGSAVKHKLGVIPLIYLAIYYDQKLLNTSRKKIKYVFKIKE